MTCCSAMMNAVNPYWSKQMGKMIALRLASLRVFAAAKNAQVTIEELRNKVADLVEQCKAIQALADAESRPLTQEETDNIDSFLNIVDQTKVEIARRERIQAQDAALGQPAPRIVPPADLPEPAAGSRRERVTGGEPTGAKPGMQGFRSFGEFAVKVKAAVRGSVDPRLVRNSPGSYGSEGVGEDGGFAVPPDFRQEIVVKVLGEQSLLGMTDQQTSSSNQLTIPKDETTPWQTSGGVQAYWENEGNQLKASKMELQSSTVRLNKLTALVPVTDELLEDVNALANYLRRKAPEKMDYKINDAIINGGGAGQPLGILNGAAKVTVAKATTNGASADVVYDNIKGMWARMYAPCRSKAVWLINQDVEPFLQSMVLQSGSATTQLGFPVYLPPGGLNDSPYARLMGRPVIVTEACQAVGTEGDIILADLSSYLSVVKAGGATIRQDVSIHLWFDYDMTAFRFIMRIGGMPWWTSPIKRAHGTNTLSCFVSLGARP